MALWYSVYHNEDYEAEIQVGPYDQWIRQLDFGPTQAERVLFHTAMMEHADERRFAVCQAGIDMSSFEADHSHRIKQALDHVQIRINTCTSQEVCDAGGHQDEALIGLMQSSTGDRNIDCSQFAVHPGFAHATLVQHELSSMLDESQQRPVKRARTSFATIPAESTDEDDYAAFQAQAYEELRASRKKARTLSSGAVLQLKPVRCRKGLALATKDHGK